MHLEIMNLISVRWMGKNSKRIELSEGNEQQSNALWWNNNLIESDKNAIINKKYN